MEIVSLVFSFPTLLLICWATGALLSVIIDDLEQSTAGQITTGIIILILVGLLSGV